MEDCLIKCKLINAFIQLWGTASNSNIQILLRFQSKTPRPILNAPWYRIHEDLQMNTVLNEIKKWNTQY
jgi:hypothetical protein